MIKVTVWNENVEERGLDAFPHPEEMWPNDRAWYLKTAEEILIANGLSCCHPYYEEDNIPCYQSDGCTNPKCPFHRK